MGRVATYDDDLRLAHVLADAVERITMSRFRSTDLDVAAKPDLTLVTDADTSAEELIRSQLKRTRPRDAVEGEEGAPRTRLAPRTCKHILAAAFAADFEGKEQVTTAV